MSTKRAVDKAAKSPKSPVDKPSETPSRWRIVRGDVEIESFATEVMARKRWHELSRTVAGEGARLVKPDGSDA